MTLTADPFTMEAELCNAKGRVLRGLLHHGTDYTCTGHAHFAGEHIRCTSPAHDQHWSRSLRGYAPSDDA